MTAASLGLSTSTGGSSPVQAIAAAARANVAMQTQRKIADKTLVFRRLPELAGFCADFLRPGRRYHVFEMRDPGRISSI
jgi:hypothetical protein